MEKMQYFNNELQFNIWDKKYRYNEETFEEWIDRISNKNKELKKVILEKKFLFGGRILANRGLNKENKKITYSNCYFLEKPEDNLESIFEIAKKMSRTFSYGGGVGIDISKLAPKNAKVRNAAKKSTGSVSFMDLYSLVTELISQNGRRGALMISIEDTHPDLLDFIDIKTDLNKVTKANISVKISNEFMKAVKENKQWILKFERKETGEIIEKKLNARDIFEKLCINNYNYAEPGILFWDNIKNWNFMSNYDDFEYGGTNPCGELPLPEGGSCLLGSINLSEFVKNPFTKESYIDFEDLSNTIEIAINSLNEVLLEGMDLHPLKIQKESVNNYRQIGLGIMGLADMFIKMQIVYGSEESIKLIEQIGSLMINTAVLQSALIAKEQGTFPKYNYEKLSESQFFIENIKPEIKEIVKKYGMAHSQLLSIAPTGSISTMLGISGGIEPIFNISYQRKTESLHNKDVYYEILTPIVEEYMKLNNIIRIELLPDYFITTNKIEFKNRINVQSVWQKFIDNSISSTINLPNNISIQDIQDLYIYAWENNLKGCTIYRDNCKREGVLLNDKTINKIIERPKELPVDIQNVKIKGEDWTVLVGLLNNKPYEIFTFKNKNVFLSDKIKDGKLLKEKTKEGNKYHFVSNEIEIKDLPSWYATGEEEFTTRLVSRMIRNNFDLNIIINDAERTNKSIGTFVNVLKRVLSKYIEINKIKEEKCPECGASLIREEGCIHCSMCEYSKC